MKQIQLTQNQIALVDDEDYDYLNQWKWYAKYTKCTNNYYAIRSERNKENGIIVQKNILMHRLILGLTDPKIFGDHKDHNGLNNQRNNIRICSHNQNMQNRKSHKLHSSKYLGVSININKERSNYTRYVVGISVNGKRVYIGSFPYTLKGEIDAAKAYDKKALELFGEFANLNFK